MEYIIYLFTLLAFILIIRFFPSNILIFYLVKKEKYNRAIKEVKKFSRVWKGLSLELAYLTIIYYNSNDPLGIKYVNDLSSCMAEKHKNILILYKQLYLYMDNIYIKEEIEAINKKLRGNYLLNAIILYEDKKYIETLDYIVKRKAKYNLGKKIFSKLKENCLEALKNKEIQEEIALRC